MTDEAVEGRDAFLEKRDRTGARSPGTTDVYLGRGPAAGGGGRVTRAGGRARRRLGRGAGGRAAGVAAACRSAGGGHAGARGTAVVIATSGSTGEPKLVALLRRCAAGVGLATEARFRRPRAVAARAARRARRGSAGDHAGAAGGRRARGAGPARGVSARRFAAATAALGRDGEYTSLVPTQLRRILDAGAAPGGGAPRLQEGAPAATRPRKAPCCDGGRRTHGGGRPTRERARRPPAAGGRAHRGAALDPATRERALAAGVRVVTTYGMSETAGGCVYDGVPLDGVTVELDPDGRILLGGPTLASGYLRPDGSLSGSAGDDGGATPSTGNGAAGNGAAADGAAADGADGRGRESAPDDGATPTAGDRARTGAIAPAPPEVVFDGGHFRTGDLGRWRNGCLEVLGRADDVVVTGGEKVAPAAVERVLAAQPGVRAACVTGLPDAEWGQVVVAAVVGDVQGSHAQGRRAGRAGPGRGAAADHRRRRDPPARGRQARSRGRRTPRDRHRRGRSPGSVSHRTLDRG